MLRMGARSSRADAAAIEQRRKVNQDWMIEAFKRGELALTVRQTDPPATTEEKDMMVALLARIAILLDDVGVDYADEVRCGCETIAPERLHARAPRHRKRLH